CQVRIPLCMTLPPRAICHLRPHAAAPRQCIPITVRNWQQCQKVVRIRSLFRCFLRRKHERQIAHSTDCRRSAAFGHSVVRTPFICGNVFRRQATDGRRRPRPIHVPQSTFFHSRGSEG